MGEELKTTPYVRDTKETRHTFNSDGKSVTTARPRSEEGGGGNSGRVATVKSVTRVYDVDA